ncbi:MAG: hypothetical protein V9G09_16710 [Candidatus Nanopelagicales bacterium]|nr:hypothetical protein [Micrococcales bacterium]
MSNRTIAKTLRRVAHFEATDHVSDFPGGSPGGHAGVTPFECSALRGCRP